MLALAVTLLLAGPAPASVATQLARADAAQQRAAVAWDGASPVPAALAVPALTEQKLELRLAFDARLQRAVLARLPARTARDVGDDVAAKRGLLPLTQPRPLSAFRVGPAEPAARLRGWYREAQRRSGVPWQVLAAVNYVEADFGRVRNESVSGAQGPMQFMPATWRQYGRGDPHDPHAAILAAGRFLRAAGIAGDERAALRRYNPSAAYADAIERYAARIRRDPAAYLVFYARQLIVRTPSGYRQLTRHGLP